MTFRRAILSLFTLSLLLIGCATSEPTPQPESATATTQAPAEEGYPAPDSDGSTDNGYPAPNTDAGDRGATDDGYPAPESTEFAPTELDAAYPLAVEEARANWNDQALFRGIVPSFQMQQNLNLPLAPGGLFLKFGLADDLEEYFVAVLNGTIHGTTIAEPVLIEPLPYSEEAIDIEALTVSSQQFRDAFLATEKGMTYTETLDALDYGLIDLDSTPNPVWSLFDRATEEALFHMDAVTGEEVESPFAPYTPAQ